MGQKQPDFRTPVTHSLEGSLRSSVPALRGSPGLSLRALSEAAAAWKGRDSGVASVSLGQTFSVAPTEAQSVKGLET